MKLTTLLFFVALLQVSANSYSQQTRLNLKFENEKLESVFSKIEASSEFSIFYKNELIKNSKEVSGEFKNAQIFEILDQVLKSENLTYSVKNKLIMIVPKTDAEQYNNTQQKKSVTGKVTDSSGLPLPGVSVLAKGTTNGTITDGNGVYFISDISENAVLQFSFVGMKMQEAAVAGKTTLNITLEEETVGIEEVVAIGYGSQRKASVTGAVANVSGKDVANLPVVSLDQAIQGRVAGVSVINNGAPGTSPIVQIRGVGSINFSSTPLYVVDGIPTNSINSISSSDIESMDILKDASATAIYGSRGSNGVIIITTKKGKRERYTLSYDGYTGVQNASNLLDLLDRDGYIKYATALMTNAGSALPDRIDPAKNKMNDPIWIDPSGILKTNQTFATTNTDWQDAVFRSASIQQHSVSLSGGSPNSNYYASASYFDQKGIMVGTSYKRYNFRINSDHTINKFLKYGETISISSDDNQGEQSSEDRPNIMHMVRAIPYNPIYNPMLDGGFHGPSGLDGSDYQNPVRIALLGSDHYYTFKLTGTTYAELTLTDWLKYKSAFGFDFSSDRNFTYSPTWNDGYRAGAAGNSDFRLTSTSMVFTNQLTFDKNWGDHNLNATLVSETQNSKSYSLYGSGSHPDNSIQQMVGLDSQQTNGSKYEEVLISYIGRVQYSFANKYFASTSYRADGSSKFAPGNKWGYFKSFSGAWRVKEEGFMKNLKEISDLKIRLSYGETGFNGIGNYVWQAKTNLGTAYYPFLTGKVPTATITQLGNPDLKWETTNMTNVGIDVKFLDNALSVSAEYYDRQTSNMILNIMPALSFGYQESTPTNIGKMSNKGFEFQLGYEKKLGELHLNVSGNISTNKNKVLKLYLPTTKLYGNSNQDFGNYPITITQEGYPIQQFYGFRVDHILQEGESHPTMPNAKPGDILFKDLSKDGKVDDDDREVLGNYQPKFIYGFNLGLTYKGFDLTAFLQGTYGNKIFNANRITTEGMQRLFNAGSDVLKAWSPTNTKTDIPRAVNGDPNNNARISDRWLEDGSYMRLKNLTIGYTVPAAKLNSLTKGVVSKLRIYATAQNLLTLTNYSGYDPEIGRRANTGNANYQLNQGVDYGQYPQPRTILGGVQISF